MVISVAILTIYMNTNMNTKIYSTLSFAFVITLVVGLATSTQLQADTNSISAQVRFVAAGIQSGRQQFQNAEATITIESNTPRQYFDRQRSIAEGPNSPLTSSQKAQILKQLPTSDQKSSRSAQYFYKSPSLYIKTHEDLKIPQILRSESVVVNADRTFVLREYDQQKGQSKKSDDESGFYSFGFIMPSADILNNGLVRDFEAFDPRSYAYFEYPGGQPLDELLLRADRVPVYQGEDLIDGSRCMKVEISFAQDAKILYWIDIEHNFLLRRREERIFVGDELLLYNDTRVPRVQESHGLWLPAIVEKRQFLDPVKLDAGQSPEVDPSKVVVTRVTISDFKANTEIPASTFVMKWPKGTNVRNQITQTGFVADGEQTDEGDQPKQDKADTAKKADAGAVKQDKLTK